MGDAVEALRATAVTSATLSAEARALAAAKVAEQARAQAAAQAKTAATAAAAASASSKVAKTGKRAAKSSPATKGAKQPASANPLDLSLPAEMVSGLKPKVDKARKTAKRKPLLPAMFPNEAAPDDSPFQLNGRLISNEMQLQMRNDSRRDVEGAAIDFQFRN